MLSFSYPLKSMCSLIPKFVQGIYFLVMLLVCEDFAMGSGADR